MALSRPHVLLPHLHLGFSQGPVDEDLVSYNVTWIVIMLQSPDGQYDALMDWRKWVESLLLVYFS